MSDKCEYCAKPLVVDIAGENRDYIMFPRMDPKTHWIKPKYICRECIDYLGKDWHKHNPEGIYGITATD